MHIISDFENYVITHPGVIYVTNKRRIFFSDGSQHKKFMRTLKTFLSGNEEGFHVMVVKT